MAVEEGKPIFHSFTLTLSTHILLFLFVVLLEQIVLQLALLVSFLRPFSNRQLLFRVISLSLLVGVFLTKRAL